MKNNWFHLLRLVFINLLITTMPLKSQNQDFRKALDAAKSEGFSGVVLVAKDGQIIFNEATGFRYFETQKTLKKSDIFELASVSKQFTAMIIMILKEKGKLNYDDPPQ